MPPDYLRWPGMKQAALYWLPWPKGEIQGPPEAFVTRPTDWDADIATVEELVARFAARGAGGAWPAHSHFGRLSGRQWACSATVISTTSCAGSVRDHRLLCRTAWWC